MMRKREPIESAERVLLAFGLVIALMIAFMRMADCGRERRAVRGLPEPERRALFERTLENLRSTCARDGKNGLEAYCREQAELVIDFPECDTACESLAEPYRSLPTR